MTQIASIIPVPRHGLDIYERVGKDLGNVFLYIGIVLTVAPEVFNGGVLD